MQLTKLAPELVEAILIHCNPIDVARMAQSNSHLRSVVYSSEPSRLWRELYLAEDVDDPRICVAQDGTPRTSRIDWRTELQRIIRMRTVIENWGALKPGELKVILQVLLDFIQCVRPRTPANIWNPLKLSSSLLWLMTGLGGGFLDWVEAQELSPLERQAVAQLHTHFGLTKNDIRRPSVVRSLALVYEQKRYTEQTQFGPFLTTGAVDWELVRAIHHVISMHVAPGDLEDDEHFSYLVYQMSLLTTQIVIPEGVDLDTEEDWAGVDGNWELSWCICVSDNDVELNDDEPLTSFFERPDVHEVFNSFELTLHKKKTKKNPGHPRRPIIYFTGEMRDSSTWIMAGSVNLTVDNEVQWDWTAGETDGSNIKSGVGIHVGGLQSWFGVLGSWRNLEVSDMGPFWLRKLDESAENGQR